MSADYLSNCFVCIATGCNRQNVEVLDIVLPENLIKALTHFNGGYIAREINEVDETGAINDDIRIFRAPHLTHEFPCECSRNMKMIYCVLKEDRTVADILKEIQSYIR